MDVGNLTEQLTAEVIGWAETGVTMLPNVVAALLVLLIGWIVAGYASRAAERGLGRMMDNAQLAGLISRIVRVSVIAAAAFSALEVLKLDKAVTSLLAGVGIVGVALGFAFQDIASNFMSGVLMAVRQPLNLGDLVQTGDHLGVIEEINLRDTVMRTFTGETVRIPNKDIFGTALVNFTDTRDRRVDLTCGVSYGDDLAGVREAVLEAFGDLPFKHPDRDVIFHWTGFGGSSIDFVVCLWIQGADQASWLSARTRMVEALKSTLDAGGFSIPFPIRTLEGTLSLAPDPSEAPADA